MYPMSTQELYDLLQSLDPETRELLLKYGTPETMDAYLAARFSSLIPEPRMRISFTTFNETTIKHMTRFTGQQVQKIAGLLRLPERAVTRSRHSFTGDEGLFLLLLRLAHPLRLKTIDALFGYVL
jgi:hypothetical protein